MITLHTNYKIMFLMYLLNVATLIIATYHYDHDGSGMSTIQDGTIISGISAKLFNWPRIFGGYDYNKFQSPSQTYNNHHSNDPVHTPVTPLYNTKYPNYTPPSYINVNLPPLNLPPLNINGGSLGTNILGSNSYGGYGSGHGGYGGNGGLAQYYGYWQPNYQDGYGYYSNTNFLGLPKAINYNSNYASANKDRSQYYYRGYD